MKNIREYQDKITELKGLIKCKKCGMNISTNAAFCNYCGTRIVPETNVASSGRTCPNCGNSVREDQRFCNACGQELSFEPEVKESPERNHCVNCGAELEEGALFCFNCGQKAESASSTSDVIEDICPDVPIPDVIEEEPASDMTEDIFQEAPFLSNIHEESLILENQEDTPIEEAESLFCVYCGAVLEPDAVFCFNCGNRTNQ